MPVYVNNMEEKTINFCHPTALALERMYKIKLGLYLRSPNEESFAILHNYFEVVNLALRLIPFEPLYLISKRSMHIVNCYLKFPSNISLNIILSL